jgi:hypothetical protein
MPLLPNGFYKGELLDIDEKEGGYGRFWQWRFVVNHNGHRHYVSAVSPVFPKGKSREYASAALNREVYPDEEIDPFFLRGETVDLEIGITEKNGRRFNSIEKLF